MTFASVKLSPGRTKLGNVRLDGETHSPASTVTRPVPGLTLRVVETGIRMTPKNGSETVETALFLHSLNGVVVEGNPLAVTIRATALRGVTIDQVYLELVRTIDYSYGRGNLHGSIIPAHERTVKVMASIILLGPGSVPEGKILEWHAGIVVPTTGPASAHGDIIDVTWSVRTRIPAGSNCEAVHERLIWVQSWSDACADDLSHPPVEDGRGHVALEFADLSSRVIMDGTPVSGDLRIKARRNLPTRGVRVDLVMCEDVLHGPGTPSARRPTTGIREARTVLVSTKVLDLGALPRGQQLTFPFALDLPPALPAPSLAIDNLRIRWELRAVVDLPFHLDPQLSIDLLGVTASTRAPSGMHAHY
jgi:hypothetical protein